MARLNELRRRWALAKGWTAISCDTLGNPPRTVWRQPDWIEGRALEERHLPFDPEDMNSVFGEYRDLDWALKLKVVRSLAVRAEHKAGCYETDEPCIIDSIELIALILSFDSEELAEVLVVTLEKAKK